MDELLVLEGEPGDVAGLMPMPWRILVVDDDADVHEVTAFALGSISILGRPLELLHAHSAGQAGKILDNVAEIAVVLLDVVMESEDAGLQLVKLVRNDRPVSYTHLDVYKRQVLSLLRADDDGYGAGKAGRHRDAPRTDE